MDSSKDWWGVYLGCFVGVEGDCDVSIIGRYEYAPGGPSGGRLLACLRLAARCCAGGLLLAGTRARARGCGFAPGLVGL